VSIKTRCVVSSVIKVHVSQNRNLDENFNVIEINDRENMSLSAVEINEEAASFGINFTDPFP